MTIQKPKKRSLVSFKDIQIAYLLDGMQGVERLVKGRRHIAGVLRRAVKELKKAGNKTEQLEKFVSEQYGAGTRGRSVPSAGQERVYRAQKLRTGGSFLRLPLSPIGTSKGGHVRVRFEGDRIVVENK